MSTENRPLDVVEGESDDPYKCNLSAIGKGKKECPVRRQVLLGVLINNQGYPFKWDVFPGNTAEVKTLTVNSGGPD